jgi:hypothetical protein
VTVETVIVLIAVNQRALLADARFVLHPDFQRFAVCMQGQDGAHFGGEVFL